MGSPPFLTDEWGTKEVPPKHNGGNRMSFIGNAKITIS